MAEGHQPGPPQHFLALPGLFCPALLPLLRTALPPGQNSGQRLVVAGLCHYLDTQGLLSHAEGVHQRARGAGRPERERRPLAPKFDSGAPASQRWIPLRYWSGETPAGRRPSPNLPKPGVRNSGRGAAAPSGWFRRGQEPAGAQLGPPRRQRGSRIPAPAGGHTANAWECMTLSQFPAA